MPAPNQRRRKLPKTRDINLITFLDQLIDQLDQSGTA